MEINSEDIASFMNRCDGEKGAILLVERAALETNFSASSTTTTTTTSENDDESLDENRVETVTVRAKLSGNVLVLWDLDDSSILVSRQEPPAPNYVLILERVVAQLAEPTPTLPYAFSLTFSDTISASTQTYRLSAFSEQDRTEWVQAIAACSHELLQARISMLTEKIEQESTSVAAAAAATATATGADPLRKSPLDRAAPLLTDDRKLDHDPLDVDGDCTIFNALYANLISKKMSLETGRGVVRVREDMAEPKVVLQVAPALLAICVRSAESFIEHLAEMTYLPPKWEAARNLNVKRLNQFVNRLKKAEKFMADYQGPSFKASRLKEVSDMAFLPTNLHLQRFSVLDASSAHWNCHDYFTCGCFSAISEGFAEGGARRLRQKLRNCNAHADSSGSYNCVEYDLAKVNYWQVELQDVQDRLKQLQVRLAKWAPNNLDEFRNVGKFAAEARTMYEQLRQLCDSIPGVQTAVEELAIFYQQYEASVGKNGGFRVEVLETQRGDFEAELACLITKVENFSQIDEAAFLAAGADRDAWVQSFCSATNAVSIRVENLRRTVSDALFYGLIRALSTPEQNALQYDLFYRRVVLLSQALTSITATLLHQLWMKDPQQLKRCTAGWSRCGVLVVVHSYLSCYHAENGMIEDMMEVTRLLREFCAFRLTRSFVGVRNCAAPIVEGHYGHFRLTLPVPTSVWDNLPESLRRGEWFYLVPAHWNVGINYEQTLAAKFGGAALEAEVNEVAYKTLRGYVKRLSNCEQAPQSCDDARDILDQLYAMLCANETKNVQILRASTQLCRVLDGVLLLCCKSGKDRTSMAVTLEEALVLQRDCGMPASHFQSTLDILRREGTRLENTKKNIGDRRYAFSTLQLPWMPELYRPPKGTYGSAQS